MSPASSPAELLLALTALGLACVLPALAFVMLIGRRDANSRLWFGAMWLYAPAVVAFMVEYRANSAVATLQVLILLILGEALRREFSPAPARWGTIAAATLGFFLAYQLLLRAETEAAWEAVLQMATLSALQLALVGLIIRLRRTVPTRGLVIVAVALSVMASINAARAILGATSGRIPAMNDYAPFTNFAYVVWILTLVCLNFGYGGFVLEKSRRAQLRDAEEAARAQARQQAAEAHARELSEVVRQRDQMLLLNSRFSALSSMALLNSSVAHEVSQPLQALQAVIDGYEVDLEHQGVQVPPAIGHAKEHLQRVSAVLTSLRALVAAQAPRLERLNWQRTAQDILPILQGEAKARGIRLSLEERGGAASAHVDASQVMLQRVIFNLVTNAFEALDGARGGEGRAPPEVRIELEVCDFQGTAHSVLRVRDNGPGIPQEFLGQPFEPFRTGREGGTGLGLALARAVLESWGGRVVAFNLDSGGACVEVGLPAREAPASA